MTDRPQHVRTSTDPEFWLDVIGHAIMDREDP